MSDEAPVAARTPSRMSLGTRIFLTLAAGAVVLVLVSFGATYAAIQRAGTIDVDVQPGQGGQISVSVPAGLADLALAVVPTRVLDEISHELAPVWPTVHAAGRELADAPDFVLVEVTRPGELVRVRKEGRRLLVRVESGGDRVHVALPLHTIRRLADRLDASI
jgi:hypothetical protein